MLLRVAICCLLGLSFSASAQPELSTGVAGNKIDAIGPVFHLAYDIKLKNQFFAKPQVGYKYLYNNNNFVGAKLKISIWEVHQTFSYEFKFKPKYTFKPNLGVNYRWYRWRGEMVPPLNTRPGRALVIGTREENFVLVNNDAQSKQTYRVHNFGFTFQLQNQYKLNDRLWFHITLFMEPDYDRFQNTGGAYFGFILKNRPPKTD